jgi:hypothetical protein
LIDKLWKPRCNSRHKLEQREELLGAGKGDGGHKPLMQFKMGSMVDGGVDEGSKLMNM